MSRYLLIVRLIISALSVFVYRQDTMTLCFLLACLTLLIFNFKQQMIFLLSLLVIPFLCYFMLDTYQLGQQAKQSENQRYICRGTILPDSIAIDGDQLSANAKLYESRQAIRVYYTFTCLKDKQQWQSNTDVLQFSASGHYKRMMPATNFNQFDMRRYYEAKHITHQLTVQSWSNLKQKSVHSLLDTYRNHIHKWHAIGIKKAEMLPQPLNEYAESVIFGAAPKSFYVNNPGVQKLGLIHLFSISGFHINYLLKMVMGMFRRLFIPKEISAVIAGMILCIYFVFSGETAVLIRAVIVGLIFLLRMTGWCKLTPPTVWSVSLLGTLIYEPCILLTLGGQLSFTLTFCLLFAKSLNFWQTNMLLSLVSFPFIVAQQYTWHILQTLVSFAVIPIFSTLIVPFTLLGFAGQDIPGIAKVVNVLIQCFTSCLDSMSMLPGDMIIGKLPSVVLVLFFTCSLLIYVKQSALAFFCRGMCPLLLFFGTLWVRYPLYGEFTTFDVGQGDAALVRTPFNRSVTLIDTGGQVDFSAKKDWQIKQYQRTNGESVIVHYLHSRGISQINNLVLSHHDYDHIGNAKVILKHLSVQRVIIPAGMLKQQKFLKEIQPYLGRTKVCELTAGDEIPNCPFHIVHPFTSGQAENKDSIALFGCLGNQRILTAGDLDRAGEKAIAERYPKLKVDILKLGHHGSKTASDPETLRKWQAQYGIISAGRDNRYNHPHKETIRTCTVNQITNLNTQKDGMIRYIYDNNQTSYFEVKITHELKATVSTNSK
ncbi:DNA internalization-related competence protein ComEC/Rec2 [Leuconostoc citreum]|uniref:DNA internalization-related competence protein ComEC/Rec2 n=1 Tax=Leuconostoc citreum TaxID=33964 RepID=UPI003B437A78